MNKFILNIMIMILLSIPVCAELEFSEANVNFEVITRPKKKVLTVSVTNNFQSPFIGRAISDRPWLKILNADLTMSPKQSQEIKFEVDSSNLPPGDYKCKVTFSSLMTSSKSELPVFAVIIQGKDDPVLKIEGTKLDLGTIERGKNPLEKVFIENAGSGILDVEITYPSWMLCDDKVELRAAQRRPIFFRVMTRELIPETYSDKIVFKSNGGDKEYPVTIKVVPKSDDPIIASSVSELNLGTVKKGRRARGKFKVINKGKGSFNADIVYPDYVVDTVEELREVSKEREILLVVDTKKLPLGLTKDVIRITSEHGILDIPFKVFVKK